MEKKKYHTKWKHKNLSYNWVHNPEEDVEWQEIPESEFTHYMHFNKGSAAKYDKICHAIVDYFWDSHPLTKDIKNDYITMFHNGHWWQLLKGNNWYENAESPLSDDVVKYGNAIMDINKYRVDKVIKLFPNHYDYLTEWYESC